MSVRFAKIVALTVVTPTFAGCGTDASMPTQATIQLAVVAGTDHGGIPYATPMSQEVTSQPVYAGDADGVGHALITINLGQREVCWDLTAANVALPATAAHIHRAPAGVRGGIVVPISPAPDAAGRAVGCAFDQDPALLQEILRNPEEFYVNVHTSEYPAGAVRGQLGR